MDFTEIDRLKSLLDTHRPLPPHIVRNLREDLVLRWTYHSNAIEGNTLTLTETKVVLEGITVGGKSMREHLEAINHLNAIVFVEELVEQEEQLSEWNIKSIHQLILKSIDDANAGAYRKENVYISGAKHTPPDPIHIPTEMENLIEWHKTEAQTMHPVERAAMLHSKFVGIHPFVDGNGRTSRLLMNLELMKNGFPPAVLQVESRREYYDALDLSHTADNHQPFLSLISQIAREAFAPYWHVLSIDPEQEK